MPRTEASADAQGGPWARPLAARAARGAVVMPPAKRPCDGASSTAPKASKQAKDAFKLALSRYTAMTERLTDGDAPATKGQLKVRRAYSSSERLYDRSRARESQEFGVGFVSHCLSESLTTAATTQLLNPASIGQTDCAWKAAEGAGKTKAENHQLVPTTADDSRCLHVCLDPAGPVDTKLLELLHKRHGWSARTSTKLTLAEFKAFVEEGRRVLALPVRASRPLLCRVRSCSAACVQRAVVVPSQIPANENDAPDEEDDGLATDVVNKRLKSQMATLVQKNDDLSRQLSMTAGEVAPLNGCGDPQVLLKIEVPGPSRRARASPPLVVRTLRRVHPASCALIAPPSCASQDNVAYVRLFGGAPTEYLQLLHPKEPNKMSKVEVDAELAKLEERVSKLRQRAAALDSATAAAPADEAAADYTKSTGFRSGFGTKQEGAEKRKNDAGILRIEVTHGRLEGAERMPKIINIDLQGRRLKDKQASRKSYSAVSGMWSLEFELQHDDDDELVGSQ